MEAHKRLWPALFVKEPTLEHVVSQCVTQAQMDSDLYRFWCKELAEEPIYHRKPWEWVFIMRAVQESGCWEPGRKGLGFGVGVEPLTAVFAKHGMWVTATDQDAESAAAKGWVSGLEYGGVLDRLNDRGICDPKTFKERVRFAVVDMTRIPQDLTGFDFCWSSCALEHLGTLEAGLAFIEASLGCVKPGGVAVHTTEFNVSSNQKTVTRGPTVLYRQRDLVVLAKNLRRQGHRIRFNFNRGRGKADHFVDTPPYGKGPHLKLQVGDYVITSIGIMIQKRRE